MKSTVVVVCMLDSVHTARWLRQFSNESIRFILFPSTPHRRPHPLLKELMENTFPATYESPALLRKLSIPMWFADRFAGNRVRGYILRRLTLKLKPDVVHAMELQNAGYICLRAFEPLGFNGRLIVTNWGSDIYWFQRFRRHRSMLHRLMLLADAYSAECSRDIKLARELGFRGETMPVLPNAGGFSASALSRVLAAPADRDLILVKGYHGWAGRAIPAVRALASLEEIVRPFKIVVYSANFRTRLEIVRQRRASKNLTFEVHRKKRLSHDQMQELFARAKLYVGISRTDGISTSMLEAMAFGAIPVQTSTSCASEWFSSSGVLVNKIDVQSISAAICRGLDLANDASNLAYNRSIIQSRASAELVLSALKGFYVSG